MNEELLMTAKCPDDWTFSRFVENRLNGEISGTVLEHVAGCPRCRAKAAELTCWLSCAQQDAPTTETRDMVHRTWLRAQWRRVAERLTPDTVALAAADGQAGDQRQMKNALGSGFIHFLSRTPRGLKTGWHVKLSIPPCPTTKTLLRLTVLDGTDEPVQQGTLHFCRIPISVADGRAVISLANFQRNMNEAVISLRREDGTDVPGDPVLGYDLMPS